MQGEYSLIIFTLLIQMAVGMSFVLLLIDYKLKMRDFTGKGIITVAALGLVGLLVSFLHLGYPWNAFNVLRGVGNSWLSREVISTSAFMGLTIISAWLFWRGDRNKFVQVQWVGVIIGIFTIYSMAKVYMVSIIPVWSHIQTLIAFLGTSLILGSLGIAVCYKMFFKDGIEKGNIIFQYTSVIAIIAIAIQGLALPSYFTAIANGGAFTQLTTQLIANSYGIVLILRWLLAFLGAAVLSAMIWVKASQEKSFVPANLVYLSFTCVLLAEIIGRYLFYATAVPITFGL